MKKLNSIKKAAAIACIFFVIFQSTSTLATVPIGTLASWDFTGKGGQSNIAATSIASGISSAITSVGSGLQAANFAGNGLTAINDTAKSLATALSSDQYMSFTITPSAGDSLTITKISIRPVSQNRIRSFTLYSSVNGFTAGNEIATFTATSLYNALQDVIVSGITKVSSAIEFRLYIYAASNNMYETVGIGERSGAGLDLIIENTNADTQAPTVPTGLASSGITSSGFTLSWTASSDNVAVTGYEVFKDGVSIGTTASTSIAVNGLNASTTYAMTVKAKDVAGNTSAASSALNVTTDISSDILAPSVPAGLAATAIAATSFILSWSASTDNVGVTGYEVFKNGSSIGTTATTSMNATGLSASTTYAMSVRARDAVPNWSAQSTAINVTTIAASFTKNYKLLNIGNSFTGWNGLPGYLNQVANDAGYLYTYTEIAPGNSYLKTDWDGTAAGGSEKTEIATKTYNAFVLQPESQEYHDYEYPHAKDTMNKYYKLFYDFGKANNSTMFMLAYWHGQCTPSTTEQLLIDSAFIKAADFCGPDVAIIPCGRVWYNVRQAIAKGEIKGIDAASSYIDNGHPSPYSQYVNALTHFAVIFKQNPEGLIAFDNAQDTKIPPYYVSPENSLKIQHIVWETVKAFPYSRVDTTDLPTAKISSSSSYNALATPFTFDASQSSPLAGAAIAEYRWNFGDNSAVNITTTPTTTHSYASSGSFITRVVIVQNDGKTAAAYVQIKTGSLPPVAMFGSDKQSSVTVPATINFDASASYDLGGSITNYAWDFGDGSSVVSGTQAIVAHTFTSSGVFNAQLTVTDNSSTTAKFNQRIIIGNTDIVDTIYTSDNGLVTAEGTNYYNNLLDITGRDFDGPYYKFDLAKAINNSVIIKSAVLHLFYNDLAYYQNVIVRQSTDNWTGPTVYNNHPAAGTPIDTVAMAGQKWYDFDVTNYIKQEYTGDKVASMSLIGTTYAMYCTTGFQNPSRTNKPALIITSNLNPTSDTQAPTAPTGLISSNITTNSFTLSWTASTDNIGVTGYNVYKDGTLYGSSPTTSINVTGLTATTTYSMTVKAKDAAGNISVASPVLNVTTNSPGTTYTLTVNSGSGSGNYSAGTVVNISANAPAAGKVFDKWTGSTSGIASNNSATTTITMSAANISITATYKDVLYTLMVTSGTGSGSYASGTVVNISANAPAAGKVFDKWTGATTGIANINSASTTITMPTANTSITATFKDVPVTTFTLTIVGGTGSGKYAAGTVVNISANAPASGKVFDKWTGVATGIANINTTTTTFTMSASNVTITATYKDVVGLGNTASVIDFYPNPAHDVININQSGAISIYDLNGVLQVQKILTGDQNQIDVSNLPNGIYIIKLGSDENSITEKIMKE